MIRDGPGHVGLRKRGFVRFVVPVPPVAHEVDHHIATKFLPKLKGQLHDARHFGRAVAVHMEHRRLDDLCHIRAMIGRSCVGRQGRESDLVVDDNVDRSARRIAGKLGEVQCLGHDTLSRKRCVTMKKDGNHRLPVGRVVKESLPCPRLPFNPRVHCLQVAWIRREHDRHGVTRLGLADGFESEVVFHIPVPGDHVGHIVLGELVKQHFQRLPKKIGQHAQSPAMRHPHHDLLATDRRHQFQQTLEGHEDRFTAFNGEALLPHIATMQKLLKRFSLEQPAQQVHLRLTLGEVVRFRGFDPVQQPSPHLWIVDVHELKPRRVTVDAPQILQHLAQGHGHARTEEVGRHRRAEFLLRESQSFQGERQRLRCSLAQGIQPRRRMTQRTVIVNRVRHAHSEVQRFLGQPLHSTLSLLRFQMGHAQLESLKKRGPGRFDSTGVLLPLVVLTLKKIGIRARWQRGAHDGGLSEIGKRLEGLRLKMEGGRCLSQKSVRIPAFG